MKIALIVAVADNGVIGNGGKLPWHLPDDLAWFKQQTTGKPVIMGRGTYESIARLLPYRPNIILTSQKDYRIPGALIAHDIDDAIAKATQEAHRLGAEELMVIGGQRVYADFLPRAHRIYLTRVHKEVAGDAYFPEFKRSDWKKVVEVRHPADAQHAVAFTSQILERG